MIITQDHQQQTIIEVLDQPVSHLLIQGDHQALIHRRRQHHRPQADVVTEVTVVASTVQAWIHIIKDPARRADTAA